MKSAAFISPRVSEPFEHEGVKFQVRGLTAEERMPLLFSANNGMDRVEFGPEAFRKAIRSGLTGWDATDPVWSRDIDANIVRLSDESYLAIGRRILDLTFVKEEAAENLSSPSP